MIRITTRCDLLRFMSEVILLVFQEEIRQQLMARLNLR
jgi:hypothetical protein